MVMVLTAVLSATPELTEVDQQLAALEEQQTSTAWMKTGAGLGIAGGAGFVAGFVLVGLGISGSCSFFSSCGRNPYEGFFEAGGAIMGISAGVSIAGAVMAITVRLLRSGEVGRHIARLEERRALLERGERPTRAALSRIADRHRPSLGPAVTLFSIGGAGTVVGAVMLVLMSKSYIAWPLLAGVLPMLIGVGFTALGFRELAVRDRENAAIDAELPPPAIESRLPPAPVLLGYSWTF